ncbi:EAL domain-containing protein [Marinobacter sp. C2H3]|uniref:EAL domain-containing protein n=1 Tax=Marinobacter sp. C2H3 TaxID=3119003 RepID=UPI00300F2B58
MREEFGFLELQQRIHELIARNAPVPDTLADIARLAETLLPGAIVSIMRYEPESDTLNLVPSPRFSAQFTESLQRIPLGPDKGTCGTAAHQRSLVITRDIREDPRWDGYHDVAESEGVRACWSMPIVTGDDELLGTFATYYRNPTAPSAEAQAHLARGAGLVALAFLRERDQRDHRALSEWHRTLFENHPDGVYTFSLDGLFRSCNAALERITGYPESAMLGQHFRGFVAPAYQDLTQGYFDRACQGEAVTYETRGIHANGHEYFLEITNFPVVIDGEIVGVYGVCRDISRRKDREAKLAFQASHDLLTGLLNQVAFTEALTVAAQTYREQPGRLAAVMVNLDGFKPINAELGHVAGNAVLVETARRLSEVVSPTESGLTVEAARLAGDEFALLVRDVASERQLQRLAGALVRTLGEPFEVNGQTVYLSASIGVAGNTPPVREPFELLQRADSALQRARSQGRNLWAWHSVGEYEEPRQSVGLRTELHQALEAQQFDVHFQPVVDAHSGRLCSVEALVRWRHPTRGLIFPGEFIPLAEQTGQIIPLGRWILGQACRDIAELNRNREHPLTVAVNISSLQFRRDGFLTDVRAALADAGLPASCLELEITESVLLDGVAPILELMDALREMGVRVALDDFGTGFSSLSYLRDLPAQKVKLDRSFIHRARTDARTAAIIDGVIAMAHAMNMVVVAEGIETGDEWDELARHHCDLLQGFLFARPMPVAELALLPEHLPANSGSHR